MVHFWLQLALVAVLGSTAPITDEQQSTYDVIIVGAGMTGLTAARRLQTTRPDWSILVLEARGMIGGRVRYATMQTRNGVEFVDTGAQFIGPDDRQLLELMKELNVSTHRQLSCGENMLFQQESKRAKRQTEDEWKSMGLEQVMLDEKLQGMSVSTYAKSLPSPDTVNRFMQTFYDSPSESVSAAQIAVTCSSHNSTVLDLLRSYGHGNSLLADGGMNEVVRKLADGIHIEYNQRVVTVNDASTPSVVTTATGTFYLARQVILTVPIAVLPSIRLVPQPEDGFKQLIRDYYPNGHAYYFTMTFQRPTWRNNGKSGRTIYTSRKGPLVWMTTFDTTNGVDSCDRAATAASTLWGIAHFSYEVPFEVRRAQYVRGIQYAFRFADFAPLDVSDINFSNDELAKGTVPTLRRNASIELLRYLKDFVTINKNVHFASADISSQSLGTMNGAVHVGDSIAYHVLERMNKEENAVLNNGVLRDSPVETSTPFVYHTSSHYPPSIFEDLTQNVQHDQEGNEPTTFHYETSTHYPSTVAPSTTTMKHFSFGNLEETEKVLAPIQFEQTGREQGFVYHTSSVMPRVEPIETTTMVHFSNGNLGEHISPQRDEPRELVKTPAQNAPFEYSTTTHYPALAKNELMETPSPEFVQELKNVVENSQDWTAIQLASKLSQLLNKLLAGLRLR